MHPQHPRPPGAILPVNMFMYECGEEIPLPPLRCTLPVHHDGKHVSAMIPEPLAEIAASMMMTRDGWERERSDMRTQQRRDRIRNMILSIVLAVSAGAYLAESLAGML